MAEKTWIQDFTEGSIPRKLIRFSLPFMLSNALQMLYAMVDMLVVGRYLGRDGLAAVSVSSGIFNLMTMLALGFGTGGQIYIAQQIGAGQHERIGRTVGTLFTVTMGIGAAMTLIGLAFSRQLLQLMQTPDEAFDMALAYARVCSSGIILSYGYNMVSAVMRGMGDSRHPLLFIVIATAVNMVLDILFVGPLGLGTAGAALATIIGQGVSFFFAVIFILRRREQFSMNIRPADLKPDPICLRVIVRLGVPYAISSCAINISMMFVTSLVNTAGVVAAAAFGVGIKLDETINRLTGGVQMGGSSVVAQNFSAGKFKRIRQTMVSSWAIGGSAYLIFTVCALLFSREMFGIFTSDADVIELAPVFISASVWGYPAHILMRGTQGFIQGIGNARFSLIISILDGFVFRIGLSWLFGRVLGFGVWGYFFGFAVAAYGTCIPTLVYYYIGKWKDRAALITK